MTFTAGQKIRASDLNDLLAGGHAEVATEETSASGAYVDLATPGPSVTITLNSARLVMVSVGAVMWNSGSGGATLMGFAASGATTIAASDDAALLTRASTTSSASVHQSLVIAVPCDAGTTTFTAKYKAGGGTGDWKNRNLAVWVAA